MTGLFLALLAAGAPVRPAPPAGPGADADRLMRRVAAGDHPGAAAEMTRQYVWPGQKERFDGFFKHYAVTAEPAGGPLGAPLGEAEPLRTDRLGRSFVRVTYAVKHERAAAVWLLTYYRPAADWRLLGIHFETDPRAVDRLFGGN